MSVYVYAGTGVCVAGGPENSFGYHSSGAINSRQCLLLATNLPSKLDWLAGSSRNPSALLTELLCRSKCVVLPGSSAESMCLTERAVVRVQDRRGLH